MGTIPQPPPSNRRRRDTVTRVITSSQTVGIVPDHVHSAAAIVSGRLADARLPERLSEYAPLVADLNLALATGSWTANGTTANMPVNSFFVGHTIADSTLNQGFFAQVAYEITSDQRMYRRVCLFGTWQTWIQVT